MGKPICWITAAQGECHGSRRLRIARIAPVSTKARPRLITLWPLFIAFHQPVSHRLSHVVGARQIGVINDSDQLSNVCMQPNLLGIVYPFGDWLEVTGSTQSFAGDLMRSGHFVQRNSLGLAVADVSQLLFGKIDVFQIFQMLQDGLSCVKSFGAACPLGQPFESLFDGFRKPDCQHGITSLYKYSRAVDATDGSGRY